MIAKDSKDSCPITVSFDRTKIEDIRRASKHNQAEDESESDETLESLITQAIMAFVERVNFKDPMLRMKNDWFSGTTEENSIRLTVNTTYDEASRMDICAQELHKGRISICLAGVHMMWLQSQKILQSSD